MEPEYGVHLIWRKPGYYYPNIFRYSKYLAKITNWDILIAVVRPQGCPPSANIGCELNGFRVCLENYHS